ncbi:hypothetical protein GQ42DRAFT_160205 [Ramicandelaber brevisporus]|nr:hypothetical protein GQ42DRAFT_160205 [Ramicandelaber brevisporus]
MQQDNALPFYLEPEKSDSSTDFIIGRLGLEPTRTAGTVVVNYPPSNPVKAQYIDIKLSGHVKIKRRDPDMWAHNHSDVSTHFERKMVIDQSLRLFEAKESEYELLTSARFPFSFSLPSKLPSSLKGNNAEIKYWIEAVIHKLGSMLDKKKKVEVELPIVNLGKTVNIIHEMNAGLGRGVEPFDVYLPPKALAAGIKWTCSLSPHRYIGPGDRIQLNMHIVLPIRIDLSITKIFFGIKQYSQAMDTIGGDCGMIKGYIASTTCSDNELMKSPTNISMFVDIPQLGERMFEVMPTTKALPLLDVYHKAKVKVYLRGESDIEVEVPVIITPAKQSEIQQAHNRTVTSPQPFGFDAPPSYAVATATTTTTTALANPPGYTSGSAKERY